MPIARATSTALAGMPSGSNSTTARTASWASVRAGTGETLTVTRAPVLEHVEQCGDARERAGSVPLGHRTGVRPPPVRRSPSGGRNSHGVTGCSLQLDSRSHPARRGLLPGHPAGDGDRALRSGEVSDEKGEAYETRSQLPCPWRRGPLARRRGAGRCRHAEVSARLSEGRERFRKLLIRREKKPHNSLVLAQFAADLIVWRLVG